MHGIHHDYLPDDSQLIQCTAIARVSPIIYFIGIFSKHILGSMTRDIGNALLIDCKNGGKFSVCMYKHINLVYYRHICVCVCMLLHCGMIC